MSAIRASGANRTSACVGAALLARSRVIGADDDSFKGSEAVWNDPVWLFISTVPITPACNSSATAPRLADQASVRGDILAKNSDIRADRLIESDGLRTGSASIAANSFVMAREDGAPRLSLRLIVSA